MKRRGIFGAAAAAVVVAPRMSAGSTAPTAALLDAVLPIGTILWIESGAPIPTGWAQMDPPLMAVAFDSCGAGGAVPAHSHYDGLGLCMVEAPGHKHSISDPGHSHGVAAAPLARIIRIA